MKKIISLMMKKHEHGLVHTAFINDAIDRMIFSGVNSEDITIMESSLNFLKNEINKDCENEEMYLYPVFSGNIFTNRVDLLKKDHRQLRTNIMNLENSIKKLRDSENAFEYVFEVKHLTREFNNIFIEHFRQEKNLLFTIALSNSQGKEIENNLMVSMPNNEGNGI